MALSRLQPAPLDRTPPSSSFRFLDHLVLLRTEHYLTQERDTCHSHGDFISFANLVRSTSFPYTHQTILLAAQPIFGSEAKTEPYRHSAHGKELVIPAGTYDAGHQRRWMLRDLGPASPSPSTRIHHLYTMDTRHTHATPRPVYLLLLSPCLLHAGHVVAYSAIVEV
jgi:hypothetical protein